MKKCLFVPLNKLVPLLIFTLTVFSVQVEAELENSNPNRNEKEKSFEELWVELGRRYNSTVVSVLTAEGPLLPDDLEKAFSLAEEAYHTIEQNPFSREKLREALKNLVTAHDLNPLEPKIYLSFSSLVQIIGYTSGSWFRPENFTPGTLESALRIAQRGLNLDPKLPLAHAHILKIYLAQHNFSLARKHLDQFKELSQDPFYSPYYEGVFAEVKGNTGKAKDFFMEAEKYATTNRQFLLLASHLEDVVSMEGDIETEERMLSRLVELQASSPHAHGNYAGFLFRQGRFEEAVRYYEKAVALGPYPLAEYGLLEAGGYLAHQEGDIKKAIDLLSKAASHPLADGFLHYKLGSLYLGIRDYQKAHLHLWQAVKGGLNPADLYYGLSVIASEWKKDWHEAFRYAEKATHKDPSHALAYYQAGRSLKSLGQYHQALQYFKSSIELDPDSPHAHLLRKSIQGLNRNLAEYDFFSELQSALEFALLGDSALARGTTFFQQQEMPNPIIVLAKKLGRFTGQKINALPSLLDKKESQ